MTEQKEKRTVRRRKRPVPDEAYEVGYCKPPKETQWVKGQSGNEKGRPKDSERIKNMMDILYDLGDEKIVATTPEGKKEMTYNEAGARKYYEIILTKPQIAYFKVLFKIQEKIAKKRRREEPDEDLGLLQKGLLNMLCVGCEENKELYREVYGEEPEGIDIN